jgi:hypothetical protein
MILSVIHNRQNPSDSIKITLMSSCACACACKYNHGIFFAALLVEVKVLKVLYKSVVTTQQ